MAIYVESSMLFHEETLISMFQMKRKAVQRALWAAVPAAALVVGGFVPGLLQESHAQGEGAPNGKKTVEVAPLPRSTFACTGTVTKTRTVADIFNPAFTQLNGVAAGDEFGASVGAGDFDKDGYTDIVVGARGDVVGQGTSKGMAYVYRGSKNGISTTPSVVLNGEQSKGEFGRTLTVGDVNGDGYADIMIGAHGTDAGAGFHQGRIFIYYGGPKGISTTPSQTLTGEHKGDEFGRTFDVIDMDGDGINDLLVGASGHTGNLTSQGKIYIYRGTKNGLDPTPMFTRVGDNANDEFGRSLAGADVNGDGFMDLIVGTPGLTGAGKGARVTVPGSMYVFNGSAHGISTTPSFKTTAMVVGAHLGEGLAAVGDANGDGYADVAIGERDYSCEGIVAGKIIMYLGGPNGFSADRTWSMVGRGMTGLGRSVARGADLNGDGYDDFMTSAPVGTGKDGAGVHIFFGGPKGWGDPMVLSADESSLGTSMFMGGDMNGDGARDLVVGSASGGPNKEGMVRVYYGKIKMKAKTAAKKR
jgi:FG-GAP-like repeat/FG-GAP repeat